MPALKIKKNLKKTPNPFNKQQIEQKDQKGRKSGTFAQKSNSNVTVRLEKSVDGWMDGWMDGSGWM